MPAYISHAIMGEQLYFEAQREDLISIIPIDIKELRGYSLGADLSYPSKKMKRDPHDYYTKEFFLNIIKYIKENNLKENSQVMALLYGHIAHYFLDINTHPLIYYIECGCQRLGKISNHNLVEGYLSEYLAKKILGKNIMQIKSNYFNQVDLNNKEVSRLLNTIYGKIYGDYNIVQTYKMVINLFSMLENILKSGMITYENIVQLSQFQQFLEKNKLTLNEITNEEHNIYTNPVTGEKSRDSFLELYYKSIDMTLDAIKKVNKYIYEGTPISTLDSTFLGLSYNTGVNENLGNKMSYVRRRIKR